ncbi:MAG: methyltransferase domain-containing protein [Anaerolineales bacterium]|nr:methyltransferase domain-containing protein [Anaerolineales bacterium]
MNIYSSKIRQDFDRIANLPDEGWNHNHHYHPYLLRHLPTQSDADALDIGCGTGTITRLLAQRFRRVLALDLSPRMIEVAKERSKEYPNIDYQVGEVMEYPLPAQFGCVVSIATLHHIPFEPILTKIKQALAPGGVLLILDLYRAETLADYATSAVAIPVNLALKWLKNGRIRASAEARAAWEEHGHTDVYLPLSEVRAVCSGLLPHAKITRHLLFRYSLVWEKYETHQTSPSHPHPDPRGVGLCPAWEPNPRGERSPYRTNYSHAHP